MRKLTLNGFHTLASISHRLCTKHVDINKFHNLVITGSNRFYSVDPYQVPKEFTAFIKWHFERHETVPYTKRTRFIPLPLAFEKIEGQVPFEEFKQKFEGKFMPQTHPNSVRTRKILNNVLDRLKRERKKMRSTNCSSEYSILRRIWLRLIGKLPPSMSHLDGLNWEILIVNFPLMVGQCFPGGKIVLSTAMIENFSKDSVIATFIAHEVAHIVARHPAELITKSVWIYSVHHMLEKFVAIDYKKRVLPLVARLPFNRRFEYEADYIGLLLMAAAGYNPEVAGTYSLGGDGEDRRL
ncbi:hypothetical protein P8452_51163 [Trifolium repens]|nr:hypothetical protein P8452_51163 [Trifolium repens]